MTSYLFPGQGSQVKGMGKKLFEQFPEETTLASNILGYPIDDLCLQNPDNKLGQTQYTQPALYVVNALSYLDEQRRQSSAPEFVAGHSLGEYNALMASGALSFEEGLKLVKKRGELMSKAPEGGMAAVIGLTIDEVRRCLFDNALNNIDIANINAPTQVVIAGPITDIHKCFKTFENAGGSYIPLNVSGAFHSRYMATAREEFSTYLATYQFGPITTPVIANVTARPYEETHIAKMLADQITHSVRWTETISYLLHVGETDFKELGPGDVLTKLLAKIKAAPSAIAAPTPLTSSRLSSEPDRSSPDKVTISEQRLTEEQLAALVHDWNMRYPRGTEVQVDGYDGALTTRTEAMILFGHRAAIYMDGKKGYFPLVKVKPVSSQSA